MWFVQNQKPYLDNIKTLHQRIIQPLEKLTQRGGEALAEGKIDESHIISANAEAAIGISASYIEAVQKYLVPTEELMSSSPISEIKFSTNQITKIKTEEIVSLQLADFFAKSGITLSDPSSNSIISRDERFKNLLKDVRNDNSNLFSDNKLSPYIAEFEDTSIKSLLKVYHAKNNIEACFAIFNISRTRATRILASLSTNAATIDLLSSEIIKYLDNDSLSKAYCEEFTAYVNTKRDYNSQVQACEELFTSFDNNHKKVLEDKKELFLSRKFAEYQNKTQEICKSPQLYLRYIYQMMSKGLGRPPICLALIARTRQCNLFIWELSENTDNKLKCILCNYNTGNITTYHLKISNDVGKYDLLDDIGEKSLIDQIKNNSFIPFNFDHNANLGTSFPVISDEDIIEDSILDSPDEFDDSSQAEVVSLTGDEQNSKSSDTSNTKKNKRMRIDSDPSSGLFRHTSIDSQEHGIEAEESNKSEKFNKNSKN
jgi:hypothetical protein